MTCKDCIHYDDCKRENDGATRYYCVSAPRTNVNERCKWFKDKSKIIELPCKVGDKVYSFCEAFGSVLTYKIECVHFWSNSVIGFEAFSSGNDELLDTIDFELDDIGKTVFLTKE